MARVNIHEAKTHLSRLLARVAKGEEIIIARDGEPIARLVPFTSHLGARIVGRGKGDFQISPDFDEPLPPDVLSSFEK